MQATKKIKKRERKAKNEKKSKNLDMHWSCRHQTSTKNTWQQTKHFNVDFHSNGCYFFFINIKEKH